MKWTENESAILKEVIWTWPVQPRDQETALLHDEVKREWTTTFSNLWHKKIASTRYFPFYPNEDTADENAILAISKQDVLTLFDAAVLISLYGPTLMLIDTVKGFAGTITKDILRGRLNPRNPRDGRVFSETTEPISPEWTITRAELEEYSDAVFSGCCSVKGLTIREKEKKWDVCVPPTATDREGPQNDKSVRHKERRLLDRQNEALRTLIDSLEHAAINRGEQFDRHALRESKRELLTMLIAQSPQLFSISWDTFLTFWRNRDKSICSVLSGVKPKAVEGHGPP